MTATYNRPLVNLRVFIALLGACLREAGLSSAEGEEFGAGGGRMNRMFDWSF
jgi:hypothetical protein